ncbi:DUF4861 family protein [Parapedobacter sp. 10938]|uniref:DUF4861 family protein n=1 Tax=Parapedobacter flavus TaxID=3110225 RepID=UPI002DB81547|nr:DUF4861 family protein [Parapedobacter sp. 10938]MEC3881520.1 DUF4861 family protein [Parapedobacter sp. 10938]
MKSKLAIYSLLPFAVAAMACGGGEPSKSIVVTNPLNMERHELVAVPYGEFVAAFGPDSIFKVVDVTNGTEIPYQLETEGASAPQNVLLYVSVPASGDVTLAVEKSAPEPVAAKTFARYVPERYDDFAWENDVVAFRMYGKALEGRPDDAHGIDLWSKRTTDLVVDKWYANGDYHTDHGEGMDYYSVGMTLGAGDLAPYVGDEVVYSKHYRGHEVLDNGPLRTTFQLDYDPWQVGEETVSVTKRYTLDVGSQLNRVEVTFTIDGDGTLPVAIGVSRRAEEGTLLNEPDSGLFGYWEPTDDKHGTTGVGVVLADGQFEQFIEQPKQYLSVLTVRDGEPIVYYNGGAWDRAGKFMSASDWFGYLQATKNKEASPLQVEIK